MPRAKRVGSSPQNDKRYGFAIELDQLSAARAFGANYFNLLRRGADGSLVLSADHWRLEHDKSTPEAFCFSAKEDDASELIVPLEQVEKLTWDRLPKQQQRSQIRFYLSNGDLWTFSGSVDESALPER
ncbi:MAG TPA: hypothetical protein VGL99_00150 [Chloroflexota bacterium]